MLCFQNLLEEHVFKPPVILYKTNLYTIGAWAPAGGGGKKGH